MELHELQPELEETVDTMASDLAKQLQEKYPTLSYEDAVSAARLDIALRVIVLPGADEKTIAQVHDALIENLTGAGVEWASRYTEAFIGRFRPAYDSAIEAGVAPAPVIAAMGKISLTEARGVVRAFKKADKSNADSTSTPADSPAPAVSSTDADDPFVAPAASES
jgi:hypothetical protein